MSLEKLTLRRIADFSRPREKLSLTLTSRNYFIHELTPREKLDLIAYDTMLKLKRETDIVLEEISKNTTQEDLNNLHVLSLFIRNVISRGNYYLLEESMSRYYRSCGGLLLSELESISSLDTMELSDFHLEGGDYSIHKIIFDKVSEAGPEIMFQLALSYGRYIDSSYYGSAEAANDTFIPKFGEYTRKLYSHEA
jgi:hypothetical protein